MRVHRIYLRGRLYTDQVAANAAAARLYAARLFPKLGAPVKTECMTLVVSLARAWATYRHSTSGKFFRKFVPAWKQTML